jgi:hypothetical protein
MLQCSFNSCQSDISQLKVGRVCAHERQSAPAAYLVALKIGHEYVVLTVIAEVITVVDLQVQVALPVVEINATMPALYVHLPAPLS